MISIITMLIALFDIDGTLIKINGAGRRVMTLALEEVYGAAGPIDDVNFAGKTDLAIIYETMLAGGFEKAVIKQSLPEVFQTMTDIGNEVFFANGMAPCTGVVGLLEQLGRREGMVPGLLTGNAETTAKLKLAAAGIDPAIFKYGAYGSEASAREALVPIVLDRSRASIGQNMEELSAIIIGDTPADIACARAFNIPSVAVATGTFSMNRLSEYNPDFLLADLSDTDQVVRILREGGYDG